MPVKSGLLVGSAIAAGFIGAGDTVLNCSHYVHGVDNSYCIDGSSIDELRKEFPIPKMYTAEHYYTGDARTKFDYLKQVNHNIVAGTSPISVSFLPEANQDIAYHKVEGTRETFIDRYNVATVLDENCDTSTLTLTDDGKSILRLGYDQNDTGYFTALNAADDATRLLHAAFEARYDEYGHKQDAALGTYTLEKGKEVAFTPSKTQEATPQVKAFTL